MAPKGAFLSFGDFLGEWGIVTDCIAQVLEMRNVSGGACGLFYLLSLGIIDCKSGCIEGNGTAFAVEGAKG
jgi:hypothetical protein